jgi:hypothetical protein
LLEVIAAEHVGPGSDGFAKVVATDWSNDGDKEEEKE